MSGSHCPDTRRPGGATVPVGGSKVWREVGSTGGSSAAHAGSRTDTFSSRHGKPSPRQSSADDVGEAGLNGLLGDYGGSSAENSDAADDRGRGCAVVGGGRGGGGSTRAAAKEISPKRLTGPRSFHEEEGGSHTTDGRATQRGMGTGSRGHGRSSSRPLASSVAFSSLASLLSVASTDTDGSGSRGRGRSRSRSSSQACSTSASASPSATFATAASPNERSPGGERRAPARQATRAAMSYSENYQSDVDEEDAEAADEDGFNEDGFTQEELQFINSDKDDRTTQQKDVPAGKRKSGGSGKPVEGRRFGSSDPWVTYATGKEAVQQLGVKGSGISNCLFNRITDTGGYEFRRLDDTSAKRKASQSNRGGGGGGEERQPKRGGGGGGKEHELASQQTHQSPGGKKTKPGNGGGGKKSNLGNGGGGRKAQPVKCRRHGSNDTWRHFESKNQASRELGFSLSGIRECIEGTREHFNEYEFRLHQPTEQDEDDNDDHHGDDGEEEEEEEEEVVQGVSRGGTASGNAGALGTQHGGGGNGGGGARTMTGPSMRPGPRLHGR